MSNEGRGEGEEEEEKGGIEEGGEAREKGSRGRRGERYLAMKPIALDMNMMHVSGGVMGVVWMMLCSYLLTQTTPAAHAIYLVRAQAHNTHAHGLRTHGAAQLHQCTKQAGLYSPWYITSPHRLHESPILLIYSSSPCKHEHNHLLLVSHDKKKTWKYLSICSAFQ